MFLGLALVWVRVALGLGWVWFGLEWLWFGLAWQFERHLCDQFEFEDKNDPLDHFWP